MAITPQNGAAASTTVAAASLALPSWSTVAGRDIEVAVALDSTSSSVTSITDTHGHTYTLISSQNNGGVRTELWKSVGIATQAANIITVNVSPNCNIAAAAEEYSGVSAYGVSATGSATSTIPNIYEQSEDGNDYAVVAFGFACNSGDTITAQVGTRRQFSVPAATAVGIALFDSTSIGIAQILNEALLSASRDWAAVATDLKSGTDVTEEMATVTETHACGAGYLLNVLMPATADTGPVTPSGAGNSGFVN